MTIRRRDVLQLVPDADPTNFELSGAVTSLQPIAEHFMAGLNESSTDDQPDFSSFDEHFAAFDDGGGNALGEGFELSVNDKMKNVLKELKQNERVRLSWSRSLTEKELEEALDNGNLPPEPASDSLQSYEEKTGSNGTVFMVRERLINDFYAQDEDTTHGDRNDNYPSSSGADDTDNCRIFENPNAFLELERTHAAREKLTLDLKTQKEEINAKIMEEGGVGEADEAVETPETEDALTPTTPTGTQVGSVAARNNKKKRKGKKKK